MPSNRSPLCYIRSLDLYFCARFGSAPRGHCTFWHSSQTFGSHAWTFSTPQRAHKHKPPYVKCRGRFEGRGLMPVMWSHTPKRLILRQIGGSYPPQRFFQCSARFCTTFGGLENPTQRTADYTTSGFCRSSWQIACLVSTALSAWACSNCVNYLPKLLHR